MKITMERKQDKVLFDVISVIAKACGKNDEIRPFKCLLRIEKSDLDKSKMFILAIDGSRMHIASVFSVRLCRILENNIIEGNYINTVTSNFITLEKVDYNNDNPDPYPNWRNITGENAVLNTPEDRNFKLLNPVSFFHVDRDDLSDSLFALNKLNICVNTRYLLDMTKNNFENTFNVYQKDENADYKKDGGYVQDVGILVKFAFSAPILFEFSDCSLRQNDISLCALFTVKDTSAIRGLSHPLHGKKGLDLLTDRYFDEEKHISKEILRKHFKSLHPLEFAEDQTCA
jgi:hypothetical protein